MDEYIELNLSNYDHDDVCRLNAWGVWAVGRIEELEQQMKDVGHWECGCGHTNGANLATCAVCKRSASSLMSCEPAWKEQP
jgi:hypothetical protein